MCFDLDVEIFSVALEGSLSESDYILYRLFRLRAWGKSPTCKKWVLILGWNLEIEVLGAMLSVPTELRFGIKEFVTCEAGVDILTKW